jgi:peptidoglycan/xylan/chitin deacetylase (PgdA/CDA1 family)
LEVERPEMTQDIVYGVKRHASRLLRGRRAMVLLYHRIADEASDPFGLCVTPAHFEEHLQVIRRLGTPMALEDVVAGVRDGKVPDNAICLTFDDGYLDNYNAAAPLLEKYDIPATIFFTTGPGGRNREWWWDEIERVFFQPGELPERLEVEIGGTRHGWELGPGRPFTAAERTLYRGWHLSDAGAPTRRHRVFREVYHLVQPLSQEERSRVLDQLLAWGGTDRDQVRQERRAMTPEQARALVSRGLVTAAPHTVNHPALPSQDREVKRVEILRSKQVLEEWLDREVQGFAYPYGLYDDDTVAAVREAGLGFACSGDHGKVRRRCDLFLIPRIDVMPGNGDTLLSLFRRHLW